MTALLKRARVLLGSVATYLVIAAVVVGAVTSEVADAFPGHIATTVTKIGGSVLAVIAAATAIVRRVTPVLPDERGLLEPPAKADIDKP